jgi:acetylornithine deacetylase
MQPSESIAAFAVELLEKLVSFDSVSSNSNLPIIGFIEGYLKAYDVECVRVPSPDGQKSNLLARIGPNVEGGIVLSGHTDVVPVAGQAWDTDPFTLTQRAGKLYGRGSADMKAFIAIAMAMVPQFQKAELSKPFWFAFSYDEEVGCLGAPHLLEHMVHNIPAPSFAVIGEPTMMQVVTAHKGVLSFETKVSGLEWHSSQPQLGVNAVHYACELVQFLSGLNSELSASGTKDTRFNPAHSTVHVGTIHGGTARNIIPKECVFHWEIRPLPGDNPSALLARFSDHCLELLKTMRKTYPQADIVSRPISHMDGVTLPAEAGTARELVMHCAKTNQEHVVSYGTEAGVFNNHGIPAIICGPGNIQQAHKPNEYIDRSQIDACVIFMQELADRISGKTSA